MKQQTVQTLNSLAPGIPAGRRALLQGGFFILVWPTFNVAFIASVLHQLGILDMQFLGQAALRLYATFTLAYLLLLVATRLLPATFSKERFWPQLALHIAVLYTAGFALGPGLTASEITNLPQPPVIPVVFSLFQITLYVAIKTLILQSEHHLATQLNLRQAQVNVLRSQSNPHFLFNTLNLLASEIGRDQATAREIVYDLADLLRDSIRAAEREFITLEEEVRLVTLYLTLQQKRFPERLAFDIDIEDRARTIRLPSLLLQPVVENVIKHVVAQSKELTTLELTARIRDEALHIVVQDNGPLVKSSSAGSGDGLRIVRETLALHYQGKGAMSFESTGDGAGVSISLPIKPAQPED